MKKVLIISPHFVPVNAADMHRVRQSAMYYKQCGWEPEIVTVHNRYTSFPKDVLLEQTIPADLKIHRVNAFKEKYTRKLGLGSIALRSMPAYVRYVNKLLRKEKFDLIFFSTTAFQVCVLGRYWKNKFRIPYVIDMQDPWRSDHYLQAAKDKRPPKFWLSYTLDAVLERYSMKNVDGIISVSDKYIKVLQERYPHLKNIPSAIIPFAAYPKDIEVAEKADIKNPVFNREKDLFYISYIGRGGYDMQKSCGIILKALKQGLQKYESFKNIRMFFIGTSYDTREQAEKTILPIAGFLGLEEYVFEQTKRISYFESLKVLSESDVLMIPGSDNIGYTASKIYNYVWLKKPVFTLFHSSSNVNDFMKKTNAGLSFQFDKQDESFIIESIIEYIYAAMNHSLSVNINWDAFEMYTSEYQTKRQIDVFNRVLSANED